MFNHYGYYEERANKTPLDRAVVGEMLKRQQRSTLIAMLIVCPLLICLALLFRLGDHLLMDIFSWLIWIVVALQVAEIIITVFFLLPQGKFTVSLDAMCRKEIVYRRHGDHVDTDYIFYFSHHGSYTTTPSLYSYSEPGQMFYVVSYAGRKRSPTMILHTDMYEWVGAPEELAGVRQTVEIGNSEHMGETILARRPLTKGRKTKLTNEEIARDLLEDRRISDETFAKLSAGIFVICGALFFVNVTWAGAVLAVVGAAWVLWLAQRLYWKRQVKAHRFTVSKDVLMDKDPVTRGVLKWKKMRYVLSFRHGGEYRLPLQDSSVYYDAELGDTFYTVRVDGKNIHIRAVYNALDFEWYE